AERPGAGPAAPDRRLVVVQLVAGLAVIAFGWGVSLGRAAPLRAHWFHLVGAGFILAADAVVWARAGHSLLHGGGWRVAAMFALSAPFWWAFEVANWRLENWTYVGAQIFSGPAQMPLKTLSFLFVLPALAESRDLLRSFVRFPNPPAIPPPRSWSGWSACPCCPCSPTRCSRWSGWPPSPSWTASPTCAAAPASSAWSAGAGPVRSC